LKNPRTYESKRPYGIVSIGSERADCPLVNLRLPERIPELLRLQHDVNTLVFQQLRRVVQDAG
jgi:hypothetical protein